MAEFTCASCGKSFGSRRELKQHEKDCKSVPAK